MKKQLHMLASAFTLAVAALMWTGCSSRCKETCEIPQEPVCAPCKPVCPPPPCKPAPEPCKPVCKPECPPPPCKPVCPPPACKPECPPCPPKCAAPLKPCKYGPSGECCLNGVTVRAKNPQMCMLGDQYPLDLEVSACIDVCDVTVSTTLPDGVSFLRSQPEAKVEGRKLTWEFGHMNRGQTIPAKIWLKCEREGDLCTCFCVKATPVAFCALLCAKPVLVCEKCGPAEACPGDPINYTITVTNIGSCTAEGVNVQDILPDGVDHSSGQRTLNFNLGCLEPCQTKKVSLCATACKRGKATNTAVVTACNANQTSCEVTTCICCLGIECHKTGPKEVMVGQNADYQIKVVNTGDKTLHDVVVTDSAPSATSIVAAPGANIRGKQAVWKIKELKAGETSDMGITLTTCTPGYFVNQVGVVTCEGPKSCCEFGTNWKGRPALDLCLSILDNPICVGETTRVKFSVQNKGQEYDSNVKVSLSLPPELSAVDISGATGGKVEGSTVSFAPYANLAPRQTLEYSVTVKANKAGDVRPQLTVSSDNIKPITQQESLIIN